MSPMRASRSSGAASGSAMAAWLLPGLPDQGSGGAQRKGRPRAAPRRGPGWAGRGAANRLGVSRWVGLSVPSRSGGVSAFAAQRPLDVALHNQVWQKYRCIVDCGRTSPVQGKRQVLPLCSVSKEEKDWPRSQGGAVPGKPGAPFCPRPARPFLPRAVLTLDRPLWRDTAVLLCPTLASVLLRLSLTVPPPGGREPPQVKLANLPVVQFSLSGQDPEPCPEPAGGACSLPRADPPQPACAPQDLGPLLLTPGLGSFPSVSPSSKGDQHFVRGEAAR